MEPGLTSILSQFDPRVAALLGWVTLIVKVLVDWIKTAFVLPSWGPPAAAFVTALLLLPLLMIALGVGMTPQLAAQAVLLAMIAAMLAIGTTALQSRTRPSEPPPQDSPQLDLDALASKLEDEREKRRQERVRARLEEVANDNVRVLDRGQG